MMPSKAIILSAGPNGLGALRSLTLENIVTDVIVTSESEPVLYSRLYNQAKVTTREQLLDELLAWPGEGQVLIPTSDWYVDFLVSFERQLSAKFKFVLPKDDLSKKFIDKKQEVELVKSYANVPKTVVSLPSTAQQLLEQISLPMIIKPRSNELNKLGQKNIIINSLVELQNFYDNFSQVISFCIAQELILGDDTNLWVCNCVLDYNSEIISAFTFQRMQLTPPHFGVTCYAKSIYNEAIIDQVVTLAKGLNYVGPAMVEFKFDDRSKEYKYIEINPRIGLCNYFDTSCGQNNVYATYCLALGLPFQLSKTQQKRVFVSVYEDLYSRYRDKQSLVTIIKRYVYDITMPHTFIYFAWRDPWPAFAVGFKQVKNILKAIIKKQRK